MQISTAIDLVEVKKTCNTVHRELMKATLVLLVNLEAEVRMNNAICLLLFVRGVSSQLKGDQHNGRYVNVHRCSSDSCK